MFSKKMTNFHLLFKLGLKIHDFTNFINFYLVMLHILMFFSGYRAKQSKLQRYNKPYMLQGFSILGKINSSLPKSEVFLNV